MQMLTLLQGLIHKLETAGGPRYVKMAVFVLCVVAVLIRYDVHCARNMAAPTAMDAAQVARNISEGKGYTTEFIRPLSIYLVKQAHPSTGDNDSARLNANHPDISNPPVYPMVLAGLMKVLPFHFDTATKGSFWSAPDPNSPGGRRGIRYQPDFLITFFNQFLFFIMVLLVFLWARRQFDFSVALLSVVLLLTAEVLWRFSASGLSTMLLLVIFMGTIWCLTLWESEIREPKWGVKGAVLLSLATGALIGVGGLTRYSFICLIIPVALFLVVYGGPRRVIYCAAALAAFAGVMAPWIARNYSMSGQLFGTASYNMIESFFPGSFKLQRSLQPDLPQVAPIKFLAKLGANLIPVLQGDLFHMAGGWISGFFLVGLMVGFRNPGLRRLRYFTVACIATLVAMQALARTQLSDETPEINSENLLVLLSPVVVVYGVGLFYTLLENVKFPMKEFRFLAIAAFALLIRLPIWFALLLPGKSPIAYPPYWPDKIQSSARVLTTNEMMMTDIPWATAWYGDRKSVWLTLNATADPQKPVEWQESFFAINDMLKPINALYLTPRSLDGRFQSDWIRGSDVSWGRFIVETMVNGKVPVKFPLNKMPQGYLPDQMLLCDSVRW